MNIGDLVKYVHSPQLGLVIDFDKDGDPIIQFCDKEVEYAAYYAVDIEVLNGGQ